MTIEGLSAFVSKTMADDKNYIRYIYLNDFEGKKIAIDMHSLSFKMRFGASKECMENIDLFPNDTFQEPDIEYIDNINIKYVLNYLKIFLENNIKISIHFFQRTF